MLDFLCAAVFFFLFFNNYPSHLSLNWQLSLQALCLPCSLSWVQICYLWGFSFLIAGHFLHLAFSSSFVFLLLCFLLFTSPPLIPGSSFKPGFLVSFHVFLLRRFHHDIMRISIWKISSINQLIFQIAWFMKASNLDKLLLLSNFWTHDLMKIWPVV